MLSKTSNKYVTFNKFASRYSFNASIFSEYVSDVSQSGPLRIYLLYPSASMVIDL